MQSCEEARPTEEEAGLWQGNRKFGILWAGGKEVTDWKSEGEDRLGWESSERW